MNTSIGKAKINVTIKPVKLPSEPDGALQEILDLSEKHPVLVFKKSPICPISHKAEDELRKWQEARPHDAPQVAVAHIDVIEERTLARGLTALLTIDHESPQALLWENQELTWHDSHNSLNVEVFSSLLDEV